MQWGKAVVTRSRDIFLKEGKDVFVFRSKTNQNDYFAIGRIDPLGMSLIMQEAEIVYYQAQPRDHEEV